MLEIIDARWGGSSVVVVQNDILCFLYALVTYTRWYIMFFTHLCTYTNIVYFSNGYNCTYLKLTEVSSKFAASCQIFWVVAVPVQIREVAFALIRGPGKTLTSWRLYLAFQNFFNGPFISEVICKNIYCGSYLSLLFILVACALYCRWFLMVKHVVQGRLLKSLTVRGKFLLMLSHTTQW